MKLLAAAVIAFGLIIRSAGVAAATPTVAGLWEQTNDRGEVGAWFQFAETNGLFSGRLVKMFKKPGDPLIDLCGKCVGDQRNARILGLTIISGMRREGLKYRDGSVLDPRDGSVYQAQMELSADGGTLYMRGYLLLPLLGQTQTWHRLPDDSLAPADIPKEVLAAPGKP